MPELSDEELLSALGVETVQEKPVSRSPRDERVIAGFEDIQRFFGEHGRPPQHGHDRDIFERLYAVRLDRLRKLEDCRSLLEAFDVHGLLDSTDERTLEAPVSDDELLQALGADQASDDLTQLKHVRSAVDKKAAEEIAQREKCPDFEKFEGIFEQVQREIDTGLRTTRPFELKSEIRPGRLFIVGGQIAYVAEMEEMFLNAQSRTDARLRVIFSNGTQSKMLMRSLQRSLHKDDASRRITDPSAGPLFSSNIEEHDEESGTIYVLRSKSDLPVVAENRDLLHKVGVTGGSVERRIANAQIEATFLLADVEIVTTYKLLNIDRLRLENLIHRVLEPARLDIEVHDRFGNPVTPREWFLVPLFVIDEVVDRIKDGTISGLVYSPAEASLVERDSKH